MLEDGRLEDARDFFFEKAKAFVGENTRLPSIQGGQDGGGFRNDTYKDLSPIDRAALMACCNGMGKYYVAKRDFESVRSPRDVNDSLCSKTIRPCLGSKKRRSFSYT
jgi:hypothetical protein